MKVVVSNGFGQFHLARLAERLERLELLERFHTGAYPMGIARRLTPGSHAGRRFTERAISIPAEKVYSSYLGEGVHQASQWLRRQGLDSLAGRVEDNAFGIYRRGSCADLKTLPGIDVFHYRAGLGGEAATYAAGTSATVVCDHSIAHPAVLRRLNSSRGPIGRYWESVEADLTGANVILVNSDYVKRTCVEAGIEADRIFVAHTAVDPEFIELGDVHGYTDRWSGAPEILFAGTIEYRKGADILTRAVRESPSSWRVRWTIVGDWMPDAEEFRSEIPSTACVTRKVPRSELAGRLASAAIFVFPSRAEGSARVVAEALAFGCWVITTEETGSVVRDGIDGRIVPVGDSRAILDAIQEYLDLGEEERRSQSMATLEFARDRLSEQRYTEDVLAAYGTNSG